MKNRNRMIMLGIAIYALLSVTDRFVFHIPNIVYIPLGILGVLLIIVGNIIEKRK